MSSMEQLEDNLETFGKFQPLTEAEEEAVEKAADLIRSRVKKWLYFLPLLYAMSIWSKYSGNVLHLE